MPQISIDLQDYFYELPEHRIAQYPLTQRDASKLLVYRDKEIHHEKFEDIGKHLPSQTTLIFNNTKVIPARLFFQKTTGAIIEIFLLKPHAPLKDMNLVMQAQGNASWSCLVGNLKRWKSNQTLVKELKIEGQKVNLFAQQLEADLVKLSWDQPELTMADILEAAGNIPLPPYLKRDAELSDSIRYQTVYSDIQGAVAAPTAGLHFTEPLLKNLELQGISMEYLTLHVGAGTFQPIKTSVREHPMHGEQIQVTLSNLDQLIKAEYRVAVGTTSLRTLESLYWYGVKLLQRGDSTFHIEKLTPYDPHLPAPEFTEAIETVRNHMKAQRINILCGYTEIFIFPPYHIKSCQGLITNFHLPGSTLILLVAAFVGADWRRIYQEALANDYRFLSYGDASLLLASKKK